MKMNNGWKYCSLGNVCNRLTGFRVITKNETENWKPNLSEYHAESYCLLNLTINTSSKCCHIEKAEDAGL